MVKRPILIINTDNYPTFCDNRCNNTKCKKHIAQMRSHTGGCKISKLRDTEECEGYISKRQQELPKCELCGKSCRGRITIKNRINGNELKVCRGCVKKYEIKQENGGFVTDSDTKKKESEVKENGRI